VKQLGFVCGRTILGLMGLLALVLVVYFLFAGDGRQPVSSDEKTVMNPQYRSAPAASAEKSVAYARPKVEQAGVLQFANESPDPEDRIGVLKEAAETGDRKGAVPQLLEILHKDRSVQSREAALDALEELEVLTFNTLAGIALNDPDGAMRIRAIELIGEMHGKDSRTVDFLQRIVKTDKEREVVEEATELLEEIKSGS
jgi:hypothetical protein